MNPYEPKNRIGKLKVDFHPIRFEHEDWIDALLRVRKPKPAEKEKAGMRPEEVRALLVKLVNEEIFPRVNEKLRRLAAATKELSAEVQKVRECERQMPRPETFIEERCIDVEPVLGEHEGSTEPDADLIDWPAVRWPLITVGAMSVVLMLGWIASLLR